MGINVEVFPEQKKMGQQYSVAEAKNIPWGIIIGSDEAETQTVTLKNLKTRQQWEKISVTEAAELIKQNPQQP